MAAARRVYLARMPQKRRPFLDPEHPMFARAWVRWLVTLAPLGWGGFEFIGGEPFWGIMFVAAGAYAGKVLILSK